MFDLSKSTAEWLSDLRQSEAFEETDLEELGSHLKDEVEQLRDKGLSEKEAFWVATSRLGSREKLPEEYAKANSRAVWRHRFLWMAFGVLAYLALNCLTGLLVLGVYFVVEPFHWDWLVFVRGAAPVLLIGGSLAGMCLILMRNRFGVVARGRQSWRRRIGVIMLCAIPLALVAFLTSLADIFPSYGPRVTVNYAVVAYATAVGGMLSGVFAVFLVSFAFALSRHKKSKPRLILER